ncbi:MAG: hypothetical protein DIU60_017730 [Actinomycetes bacterium]|jgi:hypothetical protein|nr:MAG: hypothetical protein DIU60_05995 [Actinomycetota bacterium]
MSLTNPLLSFVLGDGFWSSPIPLLILAVAAAYIGWVAVEYIPATRRLLERREGGMARGENADG